MASISTLEASSSTSNCHTYDVFLSFRGEDTRNNFTDHLYANLVAYGIHTFRDDEELEKGGDITSDLGRAIEESEIFIIIFSENYATSKWCLNELVKIIDCMTKKESVVLPVFYHVEPTDVRNQGGSFKDAFLEHEKDADQEKEKKIKMWKKALNTAANLSGYHVNNQSEAKFIQKIREDIITRLNRKPLHVGDNIVGMDLHLKQLKSLIKMELDDVHMIGIHGIGGIGKTTIAMAIYNDISSQFDGSSFLRVDGEGSNRGLLRLQKTLLQDILKNKRPKFSNISEGINVIKERLQSKKVLIVLDNVDNFEQLENLAGKYGWYGARSIIIITTKHKDLLELHEVDAVYEVKKLKYEESTKLFNWWAFKQNIPLPNFESLSNNIVEYADGLPIALKVLGGFLFKKSINEWESEWHKLQKIPDRKVQSVLKVSYDKLDSTEQRMFLDIACFFRGKDKDFVSRILGGCAEIGIKVLKDRCLITISENKLHMHDLLQQMGQEIIRQDCPQEPGKRSRLWDPIDVDSVLTNNTGTEAVEGLFIQISKFNRMQFTTKTFERMNKLRLLKICGGFWDAGTEAVEGLFNQISKFDRMQFTIKEGRNELRLLKISRWFGDTVRYGNRAHLPMDFEFPSSKLSYLQFDGYSLKSLPKNFDGKNLVEFHLKHSSIEQLWKGNEILDNLKVINLSSSKLLVEIPDFSSVPNLEILILAGCTRLESLPRNFHKLEYLRTLSCNGCSKLKSFPEIKGNMSKLREIDLSRTAIVEVPSSIDHLNGLEDFNLSSCKDLMNLPKSICNLSSLKILNFQECSNLKGFPEIKGDMENLVKLDLSKTGIEWLPFSIGHLKTLKLLQLSNCENLVSLPENICNLSSLKILNVRGCSNLKGFPEIKGDNENLVELDLSQTGIEELPYSIGHLKALKLLDLFNCKNLVSLPESICNLTSLEILRVLDCPKLRRLKVNLVGSLYLTCCILKQGVVWSNYRFSSLKALNLQCNQMEGEVLNHHIFPMSSLVELCIRNSHPMERQNLSAGIRHSSLEVLSVGNFNLMEGGILSDIFHQSSLEGLFLSNCNLIEGEILNHIFQLSSLERLSLHGSHFSSIPASIIQLSYLRALDLSHCQKLLQIPELPPSLRVLDVHACPCLESLSSPSSLVGFSLFRCFKSAIEEFKFESNIRPGITIVIPGNKGIPEWISQKQKGSEITIELPMDWHQNKYFLGFALYSVYVPLHIESKEDQCSLKCELNLYDHQFKFMDNLQSMFSLSSELWPKDELSFTGWHSCCHNGRESNRVWVVYYPKVAIQNEYWSNKWRHLKASFHGYFGSDKVNAKECGFHLIYMPNTHFQSGEKILGFNFKRTRDDAEDHTRQDPHLKRSRHL